jgi:hypothetical protein
MRKAVKPDNFCSLLQKSALSSPELPASLPMPVRANFDYCLYLSPMRGFVKADNFCTMLQKFATWCAPSRRMRCQAPSTLPDRGRERGQKTKGTFPCPSLQKQNVQEWRTLVD